jgi:hypothetical protein
MVWSNNSNQNGFAAAEQPAYQFNPANPAEANADWDGDGMTNLQEYRAGTDLRSAASVLRIQLINFVNGFPQLQFESVAGKTYRIEYTDELAGGTWSVLQAGIHTPAPATVQIRDSEAGDLPARWYRAVVEF